MFYRKKIKTKPFQNKTIVLNLFGENINADSVHLKDGQGTMCYNFENKNGALKTSLGFESLKLPVADGSTLKRSLIIFNESDVLKTWHFKYFDHINKREIDKIMFYNADGRLSVFNLFTYDDYTYIITHPEVFESVPVGINYCMDGEDYMLFSGEGGLYAYTQHMLPVLNEDCPKLLAICKAYENLFIIPKIDRGSVFHTQNLDPRELNESISEIDLTGDIGRLCSLVNFDDYLFIFRDYGIIRCSMYGSADNFSISEMYRSATKIFADTIVVCGSMIVFMTQDGIYKFTGSGTHKFELNIDKIFQNDNNKYATACYFRGKYYLACRLNFDDDEKVGCENKTGYKNNAIIILDVKTDKFSITRGIDISSLLSLNAGSLNTILATFYGEHSNQIGVLNNSGKIFNTQLPSKWQSAEFDFEKPNKLKIIRKILIKSKYNCILKIKSDLEEKSIKIFGQNKLTEINVKIKGKTFQIIISADDENASISLLTLNADIF